MKCRYKELFVFYCISKDNAEEVLDKLGYGYEECKETHEKDGRFGEVKYDHIYFGFENGMIGRLYFGNYVVFDMIYDFPYRYLTEKQFFEDYEIV